MSLSQNFPTIRPSLLLDFAAAGRLDPRITFARNSPAVYYDGVTQSLAEQNLLLQSQTFTVSPWVSLQMAPSVVNAGTAPDGTNTATKIIANNTNNYHDIYQIINTVSSTYTFSVFAKSAEYTKLCLADPNTFRFVVTFDLATGNVLSTAGPIFVSASASRDATTGWVRCSVTINVISANVYFSMVGYPDAGTTIGAFGALYTGDNTSGILVWGAQVEQRGSLTAYNVTTTTTITNYIPTLITAPANTARFDYNPTTSVALGLLIEELRTNLALYSSQFDNAYWSKTNATVTSNTIVAPDGTLTGDRLFEDTNNGVHRVFSTGISTTAGTAYTGSCYAKAGERTRVAIELRAAVALGTIIFDLSNGTVVNSVSGFTASIQNVGNGWYRCSVTAGTTITTTGSGTLIIYLDNGSTTLYTGNGYAGLFIWGAQVEAGGFVTSYIATVATTQTREADVATMTGTNLSSWFNADQGTVVASFTTASPYTAAQGVTVSRFPTPFNFNFNGAIATYVTWYGIGAEMLINGVYNNIGTVTQGPNTFVLSVATTGGQSRTALNGAAAVNRTGTQIGSTVNSLAVGGLGGGSALNGTLRRLYYYPFSITATQIQSLSQ